MKTFVAVTGALPGAVNTLVAVTFSFLAFLSSFTPLPVSFIVIFAVPAAVKVFEPVATASASGETIDVVFSRETATVSVPAADGANQSLAALMRRALRGDDPAAALAQGKDEPIVTATPLQLAPSLHHVPKRRSESDDSSA